VPHVRIVHSTGYRYAAPVRFTTHRVMLRPHDSHDLRLRNATLGLSPPATATRWAHDVFGNSVCFLEWAGIKSDALDIVSTLDIDHYPSGVAAPEATMDPAAEHYPFSYPPEEFPDVARLMERQHRDPERAVDTWVRGFVNSTGSRTGTMDLLTQITQAIKADFTYEAREQEGTNSPVVTLATKRGACRDFALLMMEALRALGLASRFVSGYLYDDGKQDATVGGGATHAWCAVYLPGAGWVEFDPTNGLLAGKNLIRVCSARTPEQAVPVNGGFIGLTGAFTGMRVNVEVTVGDPPSESTTTDPQPTGAVPPAEPDAVAA
jgi:transglutaminase-like putative cysteine protease